MSKIRYIVFLIKLFLGYKPELNTDLFNVFKNVAIEIDKKESGKINYNRFALPRFLSIIEEIESNGDASHSYSRCYSEFKNYSDRLLFEEIS